MRRRVFCCWLLLLATAAQAQVSPTTSRDGSAKAYGWPDLLQARQSLSFAPLVLRHVLQHHFLQLGSETVTSADTLLVRNRDYGIDYARGVLFLLSPPDREIQVQVEYLYLPAPKQRQFHAAHIVNRDELLATSRAEEATKPPEGRASPTASQAGVKLPTGLQLVGSKTIGVSLGRNREATLEQSLRVQVSGKLAEDLEIRAVLSDDNLPVLPEGNTEELGDLNKVFIEMQGPVVGGVVGDYELERREGEFVRFHRELRGGEARLRFGRETLSAGAGLAKGELRTATFRGTEGKQGPYELLSARRLDFSTILPGSERVYVDGSLQRRGENQDYVIDYTRGEIRFTSRRRITSYSEIAVDFQVSSERYRRETLALRMDSRRGRWNLETLLFQEGDDRNRPVGDEYTPEEIAVLAASGDRDAIADGIREVDPGKGDYRYQLPDSILIYDPDNGNLDVDFYEVGNGRGDYDDDLDSLTGKRFFVFQGVGQGSFAVGRLLTPPNRTQLVSARISGQPWAGAQLRGETSFSRRDENLFSNTGDHNNEGEAIDLALDAGSLQLGKYWRVGMELHASHLSPRFQSPGRGREGFYYKEWNAERDSLIGRERLAETTLHTAWGPEKKPWARIAANLGRLDRQASVQTDRTQFDLEVADPLQRGLRFRWQNLDSQRPASAGLGGRQRDFIRGEGRYRFLWLEPAFSLERDEFVRDDADSLARDSYRYLDTRTILGLGSATKTNLAVELGRRDTDARQAGQWVPDRRNDTIGVSLTSRGSRAWNAEIAWSRRTNEPLRETSSASGSVSNLARSQLSWRPRGRALRTELRYEVSDEEIRRLQQVLVLSPDGRGDYDAEGRPVGKDQGLYDKVFRFLGETQGVTQISASMRLELGGRAAIVQVPDTTASWWRRNIGFTQVLSVQEQTQSDSRQIFFLVPSAFQGEETVFGSFRARQEWSFLNNYKEHSLRLTGNWEDDLDGRFGDNRVDNQRRRTNLRYENSGSGAWTWGLETATGNRRRQGLLDASVPGRPSSNSHEVRDYSVLGRSNYRLSPSERIGLELEWTRQNDALSLTEQTLIQLTPSAILAPVRNLRIFANVAVTRVLEDKPPNVLPPFFFDAPGTKSTVTLSGSYRLGRNLNLNLTYTGIRNTDGRSNYDVKAETRAIF